jgi:hypothetical protein
MRAGRNFKIVGSCSHLLTLFGMLEPVAASENDLALLDQALVLKVGFSF